MSKAFEYIACALIWAATLAFQAWLVLHHQPLSGWIGLGGFLLGSACIGFELL